MADESEDQSVRVEIEAAADNRSGPVGAVESTRSRQRPLVVGLIAAGVVALLLITLRPERSATVDEGPAPSETSSTVAPTSSDSPATTTTTEQEQLLDRTVGASGLLSIVPVELGFLGLGWQESAGRTPDIRRTVDGVSWTPVATTLGESVAPWDLASGRERHYERLIRTDDGFAVLMIDNGRGGLGTSEESRIARLVSVDGALWEVDESFEPVVADGWSNVFAHSVDSYVFHFDSRSNPLLKTLLSEQLVTGEGLDACWVYMAGADMGVADCHAGNERTFTAAETIDPERFDDLRLCGGLLGLLGPSSGFRLVASNGATSVLGPGRFLAPPVAGADGSVVAIDSGSAVGIDRAVCDGFIEVPELRPPAVVVWNPAIGSDLLRIPIDDNFDANAVDAWRAHPAVLDRQVLLVGAESIWSIDIDTGAWSELLRLPERLADDTGVAFSEDGSLLVQVQDGTVTATNVRSGERRVVDGALSDHRGFAWIVYADNEVAYIAASDSLFYVEFPSD